MGQHNVTIEVATRRFKIACPKGQESALLQAAGEVNKRLIDNSKKTHVTKTPEQAMLMTALNLSHDYLLLQKKFERERQALESKIDLLQQTIEQAVNPSKKEA